MIPSPRGDGPSAPVVAARVAELGRQPSDRRVRGRACAMRSSDRVGRGCGEPRRERSWKC
eukprot:scaffold63509_cov63-Phaeocystis_antarctica.AAC.2